MKTPMTKEEFRAGLNDMLADAADPNGELAYILKDGKEFIADSAQFDPTFAAKLQTILDSFTDLVTYVKSRNERN